MKILKRILIGVLTLLILLVAIGFFLPNKAIVTRTRTMKASASVIFTELNDFHHWADFSPWAARDPKMKVEYTGNPLGGPGSGYKWSGNHEVGEGEMTITASEPGKSVDIDMKMMGQKFVHWKLEPGDSGTVVSWTLETNSAGLNPLKRWMNLFMDKFVGPDFEAGLKNLDEYTASHQAEHYSPIREISRPAMNLVYLTDSCAASEIHDHMGRDYGILMAYLLKNKIDTLGAPMAQWTMTTPDHFTFKAAFYIKSPASKCPADAAVKAASVPAGKYLMAQYWGAYEKTASVYQAIQEDAVAKKLSIGAAPWEVYVTDPMKQPDPNKVETDIYWEVKGN